PVALAVPAVSVRALLGPAARGGPADPVGPAAVPGLGMARGLVVVAMPTVGAMAGVMAAAEAAHTGVAMAPDHRPPRARSRSPSSRAARSRSPSRWWSKIWRDRKSVV